MANKKTNNPQITTVPVSIGNDAALINVAAFIGIFFLADKAFNNQITAILFKISIVIILVLFVSSLMMFCFGFIRKRILLNKVIKRIKDPNSDIYKNFKG